MKERLIQINNLLVQINVKGEDVFKLADAIIGVRQLLDETMQADSEKAKPANLPD